MTLAAYLVYTYAYHRNIAAKEGCHEKSGTDLQPEDMESTTTSSRIAFYRAVPYSTVQCAIYYTDAGRHSNIVLSDRWNNLGIEQLPKSCLKSTRTQVPRTNAYANHLVERVQ